MINPSWTKYNDKMIEHLESRLKFVESCLSLLDKVEATPVTHMFIGRKHEIQITLDKFKNITKG
jgi:hypothetical protein